jgi:PAS domain S-box-containing protein
MEKTLIKLRSFEGGRAFKRYIIGLWIVLLIWIIDAAIATFFLGKGQFITNLIQPDVGQIWLRLAVLIVMMAFATHLHIAMYLHHNSSEEALANERKYRALLERAGDAILVIDGNNGHIIDANRKAQKLLGKSLDEIRRMEHSELHPSEERARYKELLKTSIEQGPDTLRDAEVVDSAGNRIPVEIGASLITVNGFRYVMAIFRDMTQRKNAEEVIRRRNKELAVLYNIMDVVNRSLDLDETLNGAIEEVMRLEMFDNEATGMMLLLDEETDLMSVAAVHGPLDEHPCLNCPPERGECICGLSVKHGEVIISDDCQEDPRHTRQWPNMPRHSHICLPFVARDKVLGALSVRLPPKYHVSARDIELLKSIADQIRVAVEKALLHQQISEQREKLLAFGAMAIEAEEVERRRIARELHDQVGRNLTALGIDLSILKSRLSDDISEEVVSHLSHAQDSVVCITEQVRNVMSDLRPPMLDDYGLVPTLRWYSDDLETRVGLIITVQGKELVPRLPSAAENALFRISQEALTNVVKHAQASQATISVQAQNGVVQLVIADDGIGFDPAGLAPYARHWGLLNMTERAEAVGGQCWIESDQEHGGTRVRVEIAR